ncbi:MAG: wax ester/triacylglycerol synthase family O-acyltransferase [Candidatus Pelagadaptatus aseana]|uniref:WS/DGAT/MGAT family O-acyltransferase n=1 Tax=Candidatus Pelagadaptatus aseana TaxID=3120508 RepID=UPI0039B34A94
MNHLSGLDATFLHMESPETPMHIGGLSILELPPEYEGDFMADVRNHILNRMHLAPIFQRKLVHMPFDLANPIWVMDEDLDIDYHIRHVIVPPPATRATVDKLVARLHSSLLDRSRPLWEMYVLDGLPVPKDLPEGTRYVGLYSKMHHAALDGMGGQVLMEAVMDVSAKPRKVKKPLRRRAGEHSDNYGIAELTASGVLHNLGQTIKLARNLPTLTRKATEILRPTKAPQDTSKEKMHWFAPKTPLNVTITNQRSFARFSIPLQESKEIAKLNGVSLNDVAMAISAEGINRYLDDEGFHAEEPLLAAIPVSLRPEGNTELSNQVSMARMNLATTIKDPLERLHAINDSARHVKHLMSDMQAVLPTDFPSLGAPWFMSGLASVMTRARIYNAMPPFANVLISNVPGPNITLYFAGAKQVSTYPVSIPYHGMGLNITLQSYDGWLDFGLIACQKLMPDIHELARHMEEAHRDLLQLSQERYNKA